MTTMVAPMATAPVVPLAKPCMTKTKQARHYTLSDLSISPPLFLSLSLSLSLALSLSISLSLSLSLSLCMSLFLSFSIPFSLS